MAAFFRNDPYYPRPHGQNSRDQNLWTVFSDRYLKTSGELIGDGPEKNLPTMFITEVVEEQQRRVERKRDINSTEV